MVSSWVKSFTKPSEELRPLFEAKMAETYRQAYNMAYRLTSNRSDAEDLLQETYVRAFRFFARYDTSLPFTSWLYRIMTNIHIDSVRRASRLKTVSINQPQGTTGESWDLPDNAPTFEEAIMSEELDDRFQTALKAMTPEFRTAVVLADIQGMSYEEVAEVMDTSVGTVRSRIHRGRKQLRCQLGRHYPNLTGVVE